MERTRFCSFTLRIQAVRRSSYLGHWAWLLGLALSGACSGPENPTPSMETESSPSGLLGRFQWFLPPMHTLTIVTPAGGRASLARSSGTGSGIWCTQPAIAFDGATRTTSYSCTPGTQVRVSVTAADGYRFDSMRVEASGRRPTTVRTSVHTRIIDRDTTIRVDFVGLPRVRVHKLGSGEGTVVSSTPSSALDCGPICSASFPPSNLGPAYVGLEARPAVGSKIVRMDRFETNFVVVTAPGGSINQVMETDFEVEFAKDDRRLTVEVEDALVETQLARCGAAPTPLGAPPGHALSCRGTFNQRSSCEQFCADGATITLPPPTVGSDSRFVGWTGCDTTNLTANGPACVVRMDRARTVRAETVPAIVRLRVSVTGTHRGTVRTLNGPGIDCGRDCTEEYPARTWVQLEAIPEPGYQVTGWEIGGDFVAGNPLRTWVRPHTDEATAVFRRRTAWDPNWGGGGVTVSSDGLDISTHSSTDRFIRTNAGASSGLHYWEIEATAGAANVNAGGIGLIDARFTPGAQNLGSQLGSIGTGYGHPTRMYYVTWGGTTVNQATPQGSSWNRTSAIFAGKTYRFALDMDSGQLWMGADGQWFNGGDPERGTNPTLSGITGTVYPAVHFRGNSSNAFRANFGTRPFKYELPYLWSRRGQGFTGAEVHPVWNGSWSSGSAVIDLEGTRVSGNATGTKNVRTNYGMQSGRHYWEILVEQGRASRNGGGLGLVEASTPGQAPYIGASGWASGLSFGYSRFAQYWWNWPGVSVAGHPPPSSAIEIGKVYRFALDMDRGELWIGDENGWYNGGDPETGVNPSLTGVSGTIHPAATFYRGSSNILTGHFGQKIAGQTFHFSRPAGFSPGLFLE